MRSIRVFLAAALGLALTSAASARIGETKEQCAERYGDVKSTRDTVLVKSEGKAEVFHFSDIEVVVEYRAGRAWMISYVSSSMTLRAAEKILANYEKEGEGGGAKWASDKFLEITHWNDTVGNRHAAHFLGPKNKLVVYDESAVETDYKPKVWLSEATAEEKEAKAGEEAAGEGEQDDEDKKKPTKKDPFEGF